ncbi:peptide/nickel transport system substrate-binding protein [Deinobacterium chartae]|uniref:Peptide/nickel transport system substrate-binding protein n=1 Tax=Deinobacterium chartae TaxID=521158 RepID=A0A841I1L3_9DEIO|nr:ABC transporter substrate-binding protein [Deinobacterium chartae]MBB6099577.1 peptide/nickel transport system substrate-binding protein [Deinobacterium chartae]
MKRIALVGISLALMGFAAAQEKVVKPTTATPKTGGTYRNSFLGDPKTFNPFVTKDNTSTTVIGAFLSGLMQYDPYTQEVIPDLAASYKIENGGRRIIFNLRKGVKWSDGKPFTADDVIFSAQVHADPKVNSNNISSFNINGKAVKWTKVDADTVRADFPTVYAPALLQAWPIAPRHIFEPAYKAGKVTELWGVGTDPKDLVGVGPFLLSRYVKGERLEFTANPNTYVKDDKGRKAPYLRGYTTQILGDQNAQLAKFLAGDLDAFNAANADQVASVLAKTKSGLNATILPNADTTFGTEFIVFNWNNKDAAKAKLFRQTKFRQAMAHLVNKKDMVEIAMGGLGQPQWSPVSLGAKQFIKSNVKKYEYNTAQALKLLGELGYRKKNAQGILVDAQGKPLSFTFVTNQGNIVREKIAQIFAEDLKKVGIDVRYRPIDFNEMVRQLTTPDDKGLRDFDAILIGLTGGVEPAFSRNTWELNGTLHMWNLGGKNPESWEVLIDKVVKEGATTLDLKKRQAAYNKWQDLVAEHLPVIYTVSPAYNPAFNNRLGGLFDRKDINNFAGIFPQLETVFVQ